MESPGVISCINQPTPWCAGMVSVPKKNGAIRKCVNLKPLNVNVQREVHVLLTVDQVHTCSGNWMQILDFGNPTYDFFKICNDFPDS